MNQSFSNHGLVAFLLVGMIWVYTYIHMYVFGSGQEYTPSLSEWSPGSSCDRRRVPDLHSFLMNSRCGPCRAPKGALAVPNKGD